ncbi:phage tail protein [Parasutterella excrementihominis]|uniref:phage tail protein n=1 Tax=Parasutterella excrementihominis TaxID=487175 RepID=UPI00242E0652|nr:phage tail protein [Parasutterella excrementihominis]
MTATTYATKWTANAIETPPDLTALVSSGYPTNGDPSKGIPPTLPGAPWFHWVSQTLGCAIQGNGLTIDQTKTDQLLSAMKNLGKAIVPIGTVVFYLGTTIPDGYLLCNGASLSRTEFPELFAVLGTKCGSVDSAHFTLPDTHHRFLEGTTTRSEVGSYIAAGLPNITGFSNIAGYFDPLTAAGGALSASTRWTFTIMREPGTASGIVNFNAAGSDPIYGASTTNQPASVRSLCLIRFN